MIVSLHSQNICYKICFPLCRREKSGTINDAKDEKVQRRSCLQDKTIDLFIRLNMRKKQFTQ